MNAGYEPPPLPAGLLVEVRGDGRLGREEAAMNDLASALDVPVARASVKQIERGRVSAAPDFVACGSVSFVRAALRRAGVLLPEHVPYPPALAHLLYRRVERLVSMREARARLTAGERLFIKPADGWKRFTGFVAEFPDDYRFGGVSRSCPVWVSSPVRFVSEWRAYIARGALLELRFADHGGDRGAEPDRTIIEAAIATLTRAGAPAGYVIDFGVLATGETALIEMNDGFSFGAYDGLPARVLWAITVCRWQELIGATMAQESPTF